MRHGIDLFHDILGAKDIIKCFIHGGEDACIGGYWYGSVLWRVVDRQYDARKWGCIFSVSQGEVAEEEVPLSQLGWYHFAQGLLRGRERVHGDSRCHVGGWYHIE